MRAVATLFGRLCAAAAPLIGQVNGTLQLPLLPQRHAPPTTVRFLTASLLPAVGRGVAAACAREVDAVDSEEGLAPLSSEARGFDPSDTRILSSIAGTDTVHEPFSVGEVVVGRNDYAPPLDDLPLFDVANV
eukprot:gnl/Ergobibamus_cyprinoides/1976.p2 GENE.gnl/Ergobibamus_cyprinoides/1976~~gnl/Ergobibamus_cyprinoides/1976.p2  ORF type:complete len:132 (+),score=4.80 gnl/Ergobibamus_cyprinoides/1976:631-1026(+)